MAAILKARSQEDKQKLANVIWEKAFDGDLRAIELLLGYTDGKPKQATELTGPDGGRRSHWARRSIFSTFFTPFLLAFCRLFIHPGNSGSRHH